MSLKDTQKEIDNWIQQNTTGYWKPLEIMARLSEETGELAREINHRFGPKKKKLEEETKEIGDEIADIIFTLCCMANSFNIDLDEAHKKAMNKLHKRDRDRWEKKD